MTGKPNLLSVEDALGHVLDGVVPPVTEEVSLNEAAGRVLAQDVSARRTQPPFPASAMDGYAVRAEDAVAGARLALVGEAAAGHLFPGTLQAGQAVRIFTGGAVPPGADAVVIQENVDREDSHVVVRETARAHQHVRAAGLDFRTGDTLLESGRRLTPRAVALAASMGHARLTVARKPRVAILATGDELVPAGTEPGPGQIVMSNFYAIAGVVTAEGGEVIDLGIERDDTERLRARARAAIEAGADVLVTSGGASVGERDLVRAALQAEGMALAFWRVAMRPGRPALFGRLHNMRVLGLPGNPASSHLCAWLFLRPLLRALQGRPDTGHVTEEAVLGADLGQNDWRQDYIRARLSFPEGGPTVATPFGKQDSSMLKLLAEADCVIVRPPEEAVRVAGEPCRIMRFEG